jgi:hypothetical protein
MNNAEVLIIQFRRGHSSKCKTFLFPHRVSVLSRCSSAITIINLSNVVHDPQSVGGNPKRTAGRNVQFA